MATKHCYMHNAVTSRDMDGAEGHALQCDVEPRYQYRKREKPGRKGLLKPAGGPTNIEFGSFMPDEEAQALIKRRPGSERKVREMAGENIFEGPYPLKENCGGLGSDITGRCPARPLSSCKAKFLKGNDIFEAFTCPYQAPAPPPLRPYEPQEVTLPPSKLRRNPTKLASQFKFGGPVCIPPQMPGTAAAWAKQKMLYGSMDELDKAPFPAPCVSSMKSRELAGHTNLFGTPPRHCSPCPPAPERCGAVYNGGSSDSCGRAQQLHNIKLQALHGHDAVFPNRGCVAGNPKVAKPALPVSHMKAQELRGNDIFATAKPDRRRSCHTKASGKASGNASCNAYSRQSSLGGRSSSRASSTCSDMPLF